MESPIKKSHHSIEVELTVNEFRRITEMKLTLEYSFPRPE